MPYEVTSSDKAGSDLQGIVEYLTENYPDSVQEIRDGILEYIESLSANPHVGDIIARLPNGVRRETRYRVYRIFFLVDDDAQQVHVTRIRHVGRKHP